MKLRDKILVSALCVLTAATALALLVAVIWLPLDAAASQAALEQLSRPLWTLIACAFALGMIALAVGTMLSVFGKKQLTRVPLQVGENGSAYLTVSALVTMVTRFLASEGILNESKTIVHSAEEGIALEIRIVVEPGMTLPMVAEKLQSDVKAYLLSYAGVQVQRVEIVVEAQAQQQKAKPARVQ